MYRGKVLRDGTRGRCSMRYNPTSMELFFNLVWVAVAAGSLAAWLATRRSSCRANKIEWQRQAVALAVLALILLPAISLTDDLQACITPAEVEHGLRRADSAPETTLPAEIPALWPHALLPFLTPISGLSGQIELACEFCTPQMDVTHPLENRPPPQAV